MKPTLLILAAGLGSRYGGLKQIDPVGPNGELIIDYSIYDALRAGFGKLVFVIRHYFEEAFRAAIGGRFEALVETACAYQELDALPAGFEVPAGREKPWGTGHAILVARDLIDGPFAVINADDYYGADSFGQMAEFLRGGQADGGVGPGQYAMVGFRLRNTLSDYGAVARGVCRCDEDGCLVDIVERKRVERWKQGVRYFDEDGTEHPLAGDEVVSMNLWGFDPLIFAHLQRHFEEFLREHGDWSDSELYIPTVVGDLLAEGLVRVKVLSTHEQWFGVTYRQDRSRAVRSIAELIEKGVYPRKLWEGR